MGYASIRRFSSLKCCGVQISSASRNAIFSPFASDTPRLRAAETPAFAWVIILIRADANLRTTSGPLSVEPSSTTITSKRSEEHTSELQSLMRISYAVFCLKKKTTTNTHQQYYISDTITHTLHIIF